MTNKRQLKTVNSIMSEYAPVYPESHLWKDTIHYLTSESKPDAKIVSELRKNLKKYGKFRNPITLIEEDDSDEAWEGLRRRVANGTHRLIAAHLEGIETIDVEYCWTEVDDDVQLETTLSPDTPFTEDEIDFLFDEFRSFPVSDDLWLDADIAGSGPSGFYAYWSEGCESDIPRINEAIQKFLSKILPNRKISVTTDIVVNEETDD